MAGAPSRIGLLGDVHAEDGALAVALRFFADAGVDLVAAVGDIVDGPASADRCCALLAEAGAAVVRGNHDRWFAAGTLRELPEATLTLGSGARTFLEALPVMCRFAVSGGDLLLCHGLGNDDMASVALDADAMSIQWNDPLAALLAEDRPLWVLNGHTHRRGVWSYQKLTVVNGGTLLRDHDPCISIVDLARAEVTYVDIEGGSRVGRKETVPLSPPPGAPRSRTTSPPPARTPGTPPPGEGDVSAPPRSAPGRARARR
jgi:predicted phosphodiesterase